MYKATTVIALLSLSLLTVPAVSADDRDISCTVDVGTSVSAAGESVSVSEEAAGTVLGSCELGTTQTASEVASITEPDGCTIEKDFALTEGTDGELEVGDSLPPDTVITMTCDAGALDSTGIVDLDNPDLVSR